MLCRRYINGSLAESYCDLDIIPDDTDTPFEVIYKNQKNRGIHSGNFTDNVWYLTNGYDRVSINFNNVLATPDFYSRETYIKLLKKYCTALIDKRHISTAAACIKCIISLGNSTKGFISKAKADLDYTLLPLLSEFLTTLDIRLADVADIDDIDVISIGNPRNLAGDFWTYYVFDYEIKEFWKTASIEEKVIYGPLYLFWVLCCSLPTRPKGFCLMPRDCISCKDDKYYITIRRSVIKGKQKSITNTIEYDYPKATFRITKSLALDFLEYKELSEAYCKKENELSDMLFTNEAFNYLTESKLGITFRTTHLDALKNRFICDVLQNKGFEIRELDEANEYISYSDTKWITNWLLGDLRHLAMIDMIVRGISPAVIMELAGHDSIASACHYYNNSINMNKSRLKFLESKGYEVPKRLYQTFLNSDSRLPILGGYCHYEDKDNRINECIKHHFCQDSCPYFENDNSTDSRNITKTRYQLKVEHSVKMLSTYLSNGNLKKAQDEIRKIQDEVKREEKNICQ